MLVLLVLLAALFSILIISLFNVDLVTQQMIIFLVVLIIFLGFKMLMSNLLNKNKNNNLPLHLENDKHNLLNNNKQNLLNNNKQNLLNNNKHNLQNDPRPLNYNSNLNSPTPNEVLLNNILNNNHTKAAANNLALNSNSPNNLALNSNRPNNHSCLLNNHPCVEVKDKVGCCGCSKKTNNGCSDSSVADSLNGKNVSTNCLKNNTVNYQDVLNTDLNNNLEDCALNNSCVVNSDNTNLHFTSQFSKELDNRPRPKANPALDSQVFLPSPEESYVDIPPHQGPHPGDPDFTEVKDFWKLKKNNSDMCYIKRVLPKFYCKQ